MENVRLSADKRKEFDRFEDGRNKFAKGNTIGRMPKKLTLTYLTKLIRKDERLHPDEPTLLKHYKDRLFKNDILLAKFIDKYIPTINELTGAGGGPISITLREIIYGKDEKEVEKGESGKAET